ncbi:MULTISPECIES: cysteine hydrolase family protein [unclassified Psychrobacter]|uniref:cysteine hydrolase family protein n=1 Tax=unclassified Psychrobacter TaxID=196806 RepID=UPI0018F3BFD7|nr:MULTISPECIES: cysteine hydrolase family protein [unclassified Psychrobacter]
MSTHALIIVDIQNEYFPDGKLPLVHIHEAADNAASVLKAARQKDHTIIHIRHEGASKDAERFTPNSKGAQINPIVQPKDSETVLTKHYPNAFRDTPLKQILDDKGIDSITVIGAMSHMCIDATVRAGFDYGYTVTVVHDACTTMDLTFNGIDVPAVQVHAAIMAAFDFMAIDLVTTKDWLAR